MIVLLPVLLFPVLLLSRRGRRFLSGAPMDGRHRTDATFFQPPTKALDGRSHRSWWWWRVGWHRGGIRVAAVTVLVALAYGLLVARTDVLIALALAVVAAVTLAGCYTGRGIRSWVRACTWDQARPWRSAWAALTLPARHHLYYRRPARQALPVVLGGPPRRLRVPIDRRGFTIGLTAAQLADRTAHAAALTVVSTVLALEAPDTATRLHGRRPQLTGTQSEPPPPAPHYGDLTAAITSQSRSTLTFGLGKGGKVMQARYSDSPHLAVPGLSGGGKSNLIALLALQELMRGALIIILDPKGDSHLWAINLPNVIYCVEPEEITAALAWLGRERGRRATTSRVSASSDGIDRSTPGIRIIVVAEEMNIGTPALKAWWQATRTKEDPKESPAFWGLREVACAGRSQDIHAWIVAQMLSAASTGVSDSTIRSQAGIKAMLKWDLPGWNMAVGKNIPMPPPVKTPGRIQLVTDDTPRDVQVPYLHLADKDHPQQMEQAVKWARDLAVSGAVAAIPSGPHGLPGALWPASVQSPSLRLTSGQDPNDNGHKTPEALTINESLIAGYFPGRTREAVAKAIQRAQITPIDPARRGRESRYHPEDLRKVAGE